MRRERRKEKKIDRDQEVGKASVLACTSVCTCWREKEREWRAKRREEKGKREQERERERERERREQPPMEHTVLPCLELGSGFGLVLVLGLGLRRPRRDFGSNPGEKGLDIELSN